MGTLSWRISQRFYLSFSLSIQLSRDRARISDLRSLHTAAVGAEPNRGSPSESAAGRLQDHASVVHQGEEDEGHLPHTQPLQH